MIQEFARAGAEGLRKLLTEKPPKDEISQAVERTTVSELNGDGVAQDIDGQDSVLDTQSVMEGDGTQPNSHRSWSWPSVREEIIPSTVKDILFVVDESVLGSSAEQLLRDQSPGVSISGTLHVPRMPTRDKSETKPRPLGVMNMKIELDGTELTKYPFLEKRMREHFPWATITSRSSSNASSKHVSQATRGSSVHAMDSDPFEHLGDLAEFAHEPPATQDFEYYDPQVHKGWDALEPGRKMDIAHARAIQNHYGKVVEGGGCAQCVERGYKCKAYASEFRTVAVTQLGYSCQNCRLRNVTCDLAPIAQGILGQSPIGHNTRGLELDTRKADLASEREPMLTPLSATSNRPSLISRMSAVDANLRIKGTATADQIEAESGESSLNRGSRSISCGTPTITSNPSPILSYAESIGLHLPSQVGRVIHAMYTHLQQHHEVKPYATRLLKLEHYYSNLVTLYILAFKQRAFDLAYIVLLRFQNTNHSRMGSLPGIELAVQAFEHLPTESALCRWFSIIFSFLWGTQDDGDYDQFTQNHPGLDPLALSKLLYAVAFMRDPFTEGLDAAVLTRWCDVHDHTEGSKDKRLCIAMQVGLKVGVQEAIRNEKALKLAAAKDLVDMLDNEDLGQSSPARKGKRKVESSPARPYKKIKRGGGYAGGK